MLGNKSVKHTERFEKGAQSHPLRKRVEAKPWLQIQVIFPNNRMV